MTAVEVTVLVGLLMLCFGLLLGTTWTVQALDRQFRRLAIERRELNALRLAINESNLRCPWCGKLYRSAGQRLPRIDAAILGDHSPNEKSVAVGAHD